MPTDRENVEELIPELKPSVIDWTDDIRTSIVMLMLTDRSFFVENCRQLKPEYFPDDVSQSLLVFANKYFSNYRQLPSRQVVYDEMRRRWKKSGDWPEVQYQLNRIYEYLESLALEKDFLRDRVIEFCKMAAMKEALLHCFELLQQQEKGSQRFCEIENVFRDALTVGADVEAGDFYFETYRERYDMMRDEKNRLVEKFGIGFHGIDAVLEGGLNRKEVGLVMGMSGTGKSYMLIWMATQLVMAKHKVLFITLENSKQITEKRFDACFTATKTDELLSKYDTKVIPQLDEYAKIWAKDLHIAEFPMGKTSIEDIEAYQNQIWSRYGWKPDVIILDYLDELKMPSGKDLFEAQEQVLGQFKGWMQQTPNDMGMVGITATQGNRTGTTTTVLTEANLASCFNKIFKVDACWSLNVNDQEKDLGLMRFFVIKHRNAKSRYMIYLKADLSNGRFEEISKEQYVELLSKSKPS